MSVRSIVMVSDLVTKLQILDTGTDFDNCPRDTVSEDLRVVNEETSVCLMENLEVLTLSTRRELGLRPAQE